MQVQVFELMQKQKFMKLSSEQQQFISKMIMKEVHRYAEEHNMAPEEAYWMYAHGLIGSDRYIEVDFIDEPI